MEDYTVNKFQQDVESIDNSDFVKAIEKMRDDFSDENKLIVVNKAIFDVTFFIPAYVEDKTELEKGKEGRLSFSQRPQTRFVLVENPDKEKYIPAFTDHNALINFRNSQAQGCQGLIMSFADLASVIEAFPNMAGFVVNPFTHNLPFTKDYILAVKQNLMQQIEKIEAERKKQNITMSSNSDDKSEN